MRKILFMVTCMNVAWLFLAQVYAASDEFPYRALYPDAPVISTTDLHSQMPSLLVVDVRSRNEYDRLHVKNAINIPLADKGFEQAIGKVRMQTDDPIVFYCNSRACKESYEAARRVLRAKFGDAYVYDAGISEWARAYPDKTGVIR